MERKDIRKQISKRFIQACDEIIKHKNIKSYTELCEMLGIHPAIFSDIKSGKLQSGTDLISILLMLYPEIDAKWLLLGESSSPPFEKMENNVPTELDMQKMDSNTPNEMYIESLVDKKVQEQLQKEVAKIRESLQQSLLQGFGA